MTRVLGAVLAGGQSRRFGSDKAVALVAGRPLIEHVLAALASQCDAVIVCGREHVGTAGIADRPEPGLGPLGGLCAALHHAHAAGFERVLTAPCDTPDLPADLIERLSRAGAPAFVAEAPVIGLWPSALAAVLDAHLAAGVDRSMRRWARVAGATAVDFAAIANINTPADWGAVAQPHLQR